MELDRFVVWIPPFFVRVDLFEDLCLCSWQEGGLWIWLTVQSISMCVGVCTGDTLISILVWCTLFNDSQFAWISRVQGLLSGDFLKQESPLSVWLTVGLKGCNLSDRPFQATVVKKGKKRHSIDINNKKLNQMIFIPRVTMFTNWNGLSNFLLLYVQPIMCDY